MKLLIVGDLAVTNERECRTEWVPPAAGYPGDQNRMLVNWEFPVGTRLNPVPRKSGKRYISHPLAPGALKRWSPAFATLATNHVLDAGADGVLSTIQALRSAGFTPFGAGSSPEEIASPLVWETGEGRLTIINWVFEETNPDWKKEPGANCWPGLGEACELIRQIRPVSGWLILVLHWSDELFAYPRPEDRTTAKALAACGVDAIVCHHPHVVRGMEYFGQVPVYYSLGNFYFSDFFDEKTGIVETHAPRNREGLGVQIEFKAGKLPVFTPLSFYQQQGHVFQDSKNRAVRRMKSLSKPLSQYSGQVYETWYAGQRKFFMRWGARWHFVIRRLGLAGLLRYGVQKFRRPQPTE